MTPPKISVITVSYNQGRFIRDTIESVLQQRYPNFEHIVVDGGSTDDTLAILKSYPHLLWTSEPDRGQSDALNKGFARASGDIIAWINSDDWYADGVFNEIAQALQEYPVVLARAIETDEKGTQRQIVENTPRTFYDLMRHWIPYAWLAQSSVFFTRKLLEEVRYADGKYLDESLYFCMDLDLWVRMALKHPFTKRLDKAASYYRIYESNKTGRRPLAGQRECQRVFRRYSESTSGAERKLSFVVPVNAVNQDLSRTVTALAEQNLHDFEIVLVDYSSDRQMHGALRELSFDYGELLRDINVRYEQSETPDLFAALNVGMQRASAVVVALLQPGDLVTPDFCHKITNVFSHDITGLALDLHTKPELQKLYYQPATHNLSLGGVFASPYVFPNIIARKTALRELGGFKSWTCPPLAVREMLTRMLHKGWQVMVDADLGLAPIKREYTAENEQLSRFGDYYNAKIVSDLVESWKTDLFAAVRMEQRFVAPFHQEVIDGALRGTKGLPEDWYETATLADPAKLTQIVAAAPQFVPGWLLLCNYYERSGQRDKWEEAKSGYDRAAKL